MSSYVVSLDIRTSILHPHADEILARGSFVFISLCHFLWALFSVSGVWTSHAHRKNITFILVSPNITSQRTDTQYVFITLLYAVSRLAEEHATNPGTHLCLHRIYVEVLILDLGVHIQIMAGQIFNTIPGCNVGYQSIFVNLSLK